MLRPGKRLETTQLRARDGLIGRIDDLLFDDRFWHVRYFVVDTGGWLAGRRVLISPVAALAAAQTSDDLAELAVQLTREQVRRSPGADNVPAVTRELESTLHEYYRWPPYWGGSGGGFGLGGEVMPGAVTPPPAADAAQILARTSERGTPIADADDGHLHSTRDLRGRTIAATDGDIGEIDDVLLDSKTWQIRYLIVDTRRWWPGPQVLVSPLWLSGVSWDENKVHADLTREAVKSSPRYEPDQPLLRGYVDELHRHYHRAPPDW
jgi:sporulation protein YlmC with PRC-barrel domain